MSKRIEKARICFNNECNCSQSTFAAFAKDINLEENLALKITSGFGGGIGMQQGICGAVTGAYLVIGALNSSGKEASIKEKENVYALVRQFSKDFISKFGSTECFDLIKCNIKTSEGLEKAFSDGIFEKKCKVFIEWAIELIEDKYMKTSSR